MEMEDEKLFGNSSYERNGDIEWHLCALHKIKGIIKDIQFDYYKQSFSILFININQNHVIRVYNSNSFCQNKNQNDNTNLNYNTNSNSDMYDPEEFYEETEEEKLQRYLRAYSSKHSLRIDELIKLTRNTKYDKKNYFDIPLNHTQIYKMAYSKNLIVYSSSPDRSLMNAIKLSKQLSIYFLI